MLHILLTSPFKMDFNLMLQMLSPQDDFVALQDGVLIAMEKNILIKKLIEIPVNLFLLKEDIIARGISEFVLKSFKLINYSEFIKLTQLQSKFMNW